MSNWSSPITAHKRAPGGGWRLYCQTCFEAGEPEWWWPSRTDRGTDAIADRHWAWHQANGPGQTPPPGSGDEGAGGSPTPTPLADGSGDHRTADLPVNARPTYVYDEANVIPPGYHDTVTPLPDGKYLWQCADCGDYGVQKGSHTAWTASLEHGMVTHPRVELVEVDTDD